MKHLSQLAPCAAILAGTLAAVSCDRLPEQARSLVGKYYISEISADIPLYELRDDATCAIRAIRPGVLSYSVEGVWSVNGDSLVALLDPATISWKGDSSLIGKVTERYSRRIVDVDLATLTVEKDGVNYVYHRRSD